MASGEVLAAIGRMPLRLSARQDCSPTTITARQTWLKPEFAVVRAGCEACASCAASEAIRAAAAEGDGGAAVTAADALPAASAGPRVRARAARGIHHLRSMRAPRGVDSCVLLV